MKKMMFALCLMLLIMTSFNFGSMDAKAAEASRLTLGSPSISVHLGDTFKVQVSGENFNDLFGVEISLTYDIKALQVLEVKAGDGYDTFGAYTDDANEGKLYIPVVRKQLQEIPQASVRLAEITFKALQEKQAAVEIQHVKAVSSERVVNEQGYKDLKVLTSGVGEAITFTISKKDDRDPSPGSGSRSGTTSGQTGSSKEPIWNMDAILKEKDPVRAAEKLLTLLKGLKSEPASADKEIIQKAVLSILGMLSSIPVKEGADTYVIAQEDLSKRKTLLADLKSSFSQWKLNTAGINKMELNAVLEYTLGGRDVNKLGVYRYNKATAAWEYVREALHQEQASKFVLIVKQAGTYRVMEYTKSYEDISGIYPEARYAIEVLTAKHIAQWTAETLFSPSKTVTRAEFSSMIVKALSLDQLVTDHKEEAAYSDVRKGDWYYEDVKIMHQLQITKGYDDGTFKPNDPVTREQMVVMMMNALQILGQVQGGNVQASGKPFADQNAISSWAKSSVNKAKEMKIISGTGQQLFMPKQSSNRADTAVLIWKTLQHAK
ncbi:S-layer homology domain-containing protein [Paenibacillus alvei]|uniref:S-layer domain protein n=1 Tax=Paenibacillus alvei TaxID=44250 RepID=A0A383RA11_PAEAL|nr:S-layer homology domain-containing protein [Paenibacillus alvei]SYX83354.1 S-layer domain protein [Paenibacillus alvei]